MRDAGNVRDDTGFTLLEVIVVLALIALILGLATPFFAGALPSARMDSTGREISAAMLADADDTERGVLAGARYQPNRAVLHTDARLMPKLRSVWSSWNYLSDGAADPAVSVTYLLNRLQPLPFRTPVFVSLNPLVEPDPQTVIAEFEYSHPIFDARMIEAQQRLPDALNTPLEAAIQARVQEQTEEARFHLHRALELAKEMGYL